MSSTYDQAVEVLNAAKLVADGQQRVDHLRSLLELVVRKEPALLPEFLPEVLEMQVDPAQAVRRFLPELIDGAVAANPCPAVLTPALACLSGLLGDSAAATVRRALQSAYPAFRAAYALVALRGGAPGLAAEEAEALRTLWGAATTLKLAAAALVGGGQAEQPASDAVWQAAARFLEQAVLLLTAEVVPAVVGVSVAPQPVPAANAVAGKAAVVRDAEAALVQLVALLRRRLGEQLSPALASTAVRSAAGIAQQRPQFMGRLLPPLLALAGSDTVREAAAAAGPAAPGPAAAAEGAAGVAAALKVGLLALSRSSAPAAQPWKKKIAAALQAVGPGETPQQAAADGRPEKRPHAGGNEPSKRQRTDSGQQPPHPPVQQQQQPQAPAAGPPPAAQLPPLPNLEQLAQQAAQQQPPPTPPEQLAKVLTVLRALVASQDAAMLAGVVGSLQPAVLADVVLAYMACLPPPQALPPNGAPHEPWVLQLLQLGAQQAPPPTSAQPAGQVALPQQPTQKASAPQPQQQPQLHQAGGQQQQQQQQAAGPRPKQEPAASAPKPAPAAPTRPTAAALASAFRLEPVPLTAAQQAALRLGAVLRILRTDKTSRRGLRTSLVAKLAAEADPATQAPAIMAQLVQGDGGVGGELDVALQWLNLLFARECQPSSAAAGAEPDNEADGSGSALQLGGSAAGAAAGAGQRRQRQQLQPGGQAGSPDGSLYERTLLQLLRGLQAALPPSSRVIARVLLEVPSLPQPAVRQFLEQLAAAGPDWCTLALLAARDAILQRPPSQAALLELVLDACASPTSDTRSKAVRLVANRLFPDPGMAPHIEQAARRRLDAMLCALYCALCTKKHSLLRHLFEVYAATSDGGRSAIQRNAGGLAKTLGASAPALLAVVADPPAGSLPLVLQMLHVLTEAAVPPPALVGACLQLHERCRDARVLVPALRGLDRSAALRLLPALLDLQPEQLRPALQRLVAPLPAAAAAGGGEAAQQEQPAAPAVVSPEELLSALHTLDHSRDAALLRKMMQGVTVCISSPALFPPEALAACINQLLTRVPLPQLFMRTVIQTVAAAPRLRAFVVGVLRQLAAKQIWKDATQWKGWLMCMQQTIPDSFSALLSLPADVLGTAAKSLPQASKQQLLAFAEEGGTALPNTTLAVLRQELQPLDAKP
ncbi:hypothetical protein ABPG75_011682 [Micractinium tetrahymenae]